MEKSEKKPKEIDRISTLPDSVLCHILSFLPTRASMATSILSRRWRHLWKDLQVLDVDQDQSFRVPDGERRFIDFVDAVLARRTSPHIRKFRLSCRVSQREVLDGWSSGIGPHLQELQLSLPSCNPYHRLNENFNFWKCPGAALTSTSLVSLVLKGCVDLNYHFPVQDVHLPSLKNLEVDVCFMNIDKVLSGCPVVENLKLVLQNILNPARIRIPRSVKRLTLDDQGVEDFDDVVDIEIDNPSLEYLNLLVGRENICLKILARDFLNMVEAHLFNAGHYFDDDGGWVPKLFKALYMTNSLSLTNNTMECLRPAPGLEIPEFCRLVHLDFCSYDFNGKLLLEFLHKCNMLQVLIYRRGDYDFEDDPVDRTPPTKVPNCMISYLKTFEFDGYLDSEDERAFIAYILQEGLVLKTMKIRSQGFDINKKFLVLKELSAIPRGSNTCQLIFD